MLLVPDKSFSPCQLCLLYTSSNKNQHFLEISFKFASQTRTSRLNVLFSHQSSSSYHLDIFGRYPRYVFRNVFYQTFKMCWDGIQVKWYQYLDLFSYTMQVQGNEQHPSLGFCMQWSTFSFPSVVSISRRPKTILWLIKVPFLLFFLT